MPYRCSFIFEAGDVGWSEQWYSNLTGPPASIPDLILAPPFLQGFLGLRARGVYLVGLRVNDVNQKRLSFLRVLEINSGDYNSAPDPSGEEPAVAALGYCVTQGSFHRPVMVRGLTDAFVNRDLADFALLGGMLGKMLDLYKQAIVLRGLCVRKLQDATFGNNDLPLVSMAPGLNDSGTTTFTYEGGGEQLTPGDPVIVHGLSHKLYPGYSGPLPGYNFKPTSVDVPVIWRNANAFVPLRKATIRNAYYTYDPVASISWEDVRVKRVGRPTIAPRGRRPGVVYRSR
jgi:hypothetical protein